MNNTELHELIRDRVVLEWDIITESDWFRELVKELVIEALAEQQESRS